jgi:hypothetical protein
LPRLALNCYPPDFCLQNSWDYRCKPSVPGGGFFFFFVVLGLELRTFTLSHYTSPTFLWRVFEPQSSWSLPPD